MKLDEDFTVEKIGTDIYTTYIGDMSVYSNLYRDSDFVGNYFQCMEYIRSFDNCEVHGDILRHEEKHIPKDKA